MGHRLSLRPGRGGTTIVWVDDWPDPNKELTITSCVVREPADHSRWVDTDAKLIESRLRRTDKEDRHQLTGREKGRVLYLHRDQAFQGRPPVAAALIHVEGKRHAFRRSPVTVRLRRIVVVEEAKGDAKKTLAYTAAILDCMHSLAEEAGSADGCFEWIFDNEAAAAQATQAWGQTKPMAITSRLGHGKTQADRATVTARRCLRGSA